MCPETFEEAVNAILLFVTLAVIVAIPVGYFTAKGLYSNDNKDSR